MLLPKGMNKRIGIVVFPLISAMHGFLYGTLYAPAQALMFGFGWEQTVAWVVAGFPFDAMHGTGNLILGFLIYPLVSLLVKLSKEINIL